MPLSEFISVSEKGAAYNSVIAVSNKPGFKNLITDVFDGMIFFVCKQST